MLGTLDARNKSGQGVLTVASRLTPLDPTLSQLLNRTAVHRRRSLLPRASPVIGQVRLGIYRAPHARDRPDLRTGINESMGKSVHPVRSWVKFGAAR
jgi:hypothetical protein